jgi:hypothetical protein
MANKNLTNCGLSGKEMSSREKQIPDPKSGEYIAEHQIHGKRKGVYAARQTTTYPGSHPKQIPFSAILRGTETSILAALSAWLASMLPCR